MKAVLHFAPLARRLLPAFLLNLGLSIVTLAAGIGLLGISGWFLTAAALSSAGAAFNLFGPSAGVRGLSFIRILSRYGEKITGHDATLRLLSTLRRETFAGLLRLVPLGALYGRADLVSRLTADLDALDTIFLVGIGPIATALLTGIAMTVALALFLPAVAPVYAIGSAFASLAVPLGLIIGSRRIGKTLATASSDLRGATLDAIEGHQDIILFGATSAAAAGTATAARHLANARRRLGLLTALASGAVQALAGIILLSTLVCGLVALDATTVSGPLLVGLLLAVLASFEASAVVVRSAGGIARATAAAERLAEIETAPPPIGEPATLVRLPEGGDVEFDSVCFSYGKRAPVFTGLSFHIAAGECVALKGASGSGKSTIAQLLVRLVPPQSGTIRVNGVDISTVAGSELHQRVALMTQGAPVFNDSVRANLLIGRSDATDRELWDVLRRVDLATAIAPLPRGLETVLGEAGYTLSVGQARRICLARTLLSTASIVVLDEPTSGLDRDLEAAFLADLPGAASGRTTIVVTHADVPPGFDRVLQLRRGHIEENGEH